MLTLDAPQANSMCVFFRGPTIGQAGLTVLNALSDPIPESALWAITQLRPCPGICPDAPQTPDVEADFKAQQFKTVAKRVLRGHLVVGHLGASRGRVEHLGIKRPGLAIAVGGRVQALIDVFGILYVDPVCAHRDIKAQRLSCGPAIWSGTQENELIIFRTIVVYQIPNLLKIITTAGILQSVCNHYKKVTTVAVLVAIK